MQRLLPQPRGRHLIFYAYVLCLPIALLGLGVPVWISGVMYAMLILAMWQPVLLWGRRLMGRWRSTPPKPAPPKPTGRCYAVTEAKLAQFSLRGTTSEDVTTGIALELLKSGELYIIADSADIEQLVRRHQAVIALRQCPRTVLVGPGDSFLAFEPGADPCTFRLVTLH